MHRPNIDPENMTMEDFLCDFCHQAWTEDRPFVEGHRGACVCGKCLSLAYTELVHLRVGDPPHPGEGCALCLENERDDPHWRSPVTDALVCRRCIKQAAGALHKDKDIPWTKPPAPDNAETAEPADPSMPVQPE